MKLATYRDGSRDGQLVVVSRDLSTAHYASAIAGRLQQVLDDWNFLSPQLEDLSTTLNHGKARHAFAFDPALCMAPLPRAYQWLRGGAYPSHGLRWREAREAAMFAAEIAAAGGGGTGGSNEAEPAAGPAQADSAAVVAKTTKKSRRTRPAEWPQATQGAADDLLGANDEPCFTDSARGIDFGAGLAAITADLDLAATPDQALDSVRLLTLVNDWRLRGGADASGNDDAITSQPVTALAPVVVTPDELGSAWAGGRVNGWIDCKLNGKPFSRLATGAPAMAWHFGELIASAARTRRLRAGTIVGTGVVSNDEAERGTACIAELRALQIKDGCAATAAWLRAGDRVRIEMHGADGISLFGAIDQVVNRLGGSD
jgi:fumarylacetoacetate (FAA) hydrolase